MKYGIKNLLFSCDIYGQYHLFRRDLSLSIVFDLRTSNNLIYCANGNCS